MAPGHHNVCVWFATNEWGLRKSHDRDAVADKWLYSSEHRLCPKDGHTRKCTAGWQSLNVPTLSALLRSEMPSTRSVRLPINASQRGISSVAIATSRL
jgi:hypothetical protein